MKETLVFDRAIKWVENHCVDGRAIIVNTKEQIPYSEVTGYYIPTLFNWGYKKMAYNFAKWLCEIQNEDGSWNASDNSAAYVFDSAQILKGLIVIAKYDSSFLANIEKGCDWIISNVNKEGRLLTPVKDAWGDGKTCSELVHLYCLKPLIDADLLLGKEKYTPYAQSVLAYYKSEHINEILDFGLLSHFYAYVMEGLVDLGEIALANKAMSNIEKYQKQNGMIPAYKNVNWTCSTGMFQLALVWYKLGELEKGNKTFEYASKLQNASGGWYGSYATNLFGKIGIGIKSVPKYFPEAEISWAVKYYLDALNNKGKLEFEKISDSFCTDIDLDDGRYKVILSQILKNYCGRKLKICDVGCGKGRYLRNLLGENIESELWGIDISEKVLEFITEQDIIKKVGSLTNIPCPDDTFDIVYTVEALEHAVHIENAINELVRIVKPGGKVIVIDKNVENLGKLKLFPYERWFDMDILQKIGEKANCRCEIIKEISYEKFKADGLFFSCILIKEN